MAAPKIPAYKSASCIPEFESATIPWVHQKACNNYLNANPFDENNQALAND